MSFYRAIPKHIRGTFLQPHAAEQLAAGDPAGGREVGACLGRQDAREWGDRCLRRRAAELEAVGRLGKLDATGCNSC